ncbi:MAG TPA: hypothetical protein VGD94_04085 [Vicinamibacterales bacterium]
MPDHVLTADSSLPPSLALAFAPVHKLALGVAVGLVCALLVSAITAFQLVVAPPDAPELNLLAQYFYGYSVTWPGVAVGAFWGFVTGFVAGWFVAFVRNFVLALWVIIVKANAGLSNSFLDHI